MRDVHGRYRDTKELKDIAPPWAMGCEQCEYGYAHAPELTGVLNTAEERAVAAAEDLIVFCTCRAGHMNRQYLRRVYNALLPQQKQNYRAALLAALSRREPTFHMAGERA
jgi:hypothetical protein